MIHKFSLIPPIFNTSILPSRVPLLTRAGPIGLHIQISISKQSKYSFRINDCRPSRDYRSFLCFEVCFVKRLFAASIHVENQQLLTLLQYVPYIACYENSKTAKQNRKNRSFENRSRCSTLIALASTESGVEPGVSGRLSAPSLSPISLLKNTARMAKQVNK